MNSSFRWRVPRGIPFRSQRKRYLPQHSDAKERCDASMSCTPSEQSKVPFYEQTNREDSRSSPFSKFPAKRPSFVGAQGNDVVDSVFGDLPTYESVQCPRSHSRSISPLRSSSPRPRSVSSPTSQAIEFFTSDEPSPEELIHSDQSRLDERDHQTLEYESFESSHLLALYYQFQQLVADDMDWIGGGIRVEQDVEYHQSLLMEHRNVHEMHQNVFYLANQFAELFESHQKLCFGADLSDSQNELVRQHLSSSRSNFANGLAKTISMLETGSKFIDYGYF